MKTTTETEPAARRDAVTLLLDDHVFARRLLADAVRVAREGAEDAKVARIGRAVHRFVTFTHPQHELDEEQRVFPALRAYGPKAEVDAALDDVVEEHIELDALRDRLALRWAHVADAPASLGPLRAELQELTEKLARAIGRHAEHEELVVYPLVRKYVPPAVLLRIARVMPRTLDD
jgi:iron-sulfur cluster repair protein YtfE (RIC family)